MTLAEAALLSGDALIVKGGPVTVAGTVAAVLGLSAVQANSHYANGYLLAAQDTAAHIVALTTTQIAALTALHVTQIAASDTTIALSVAQAAAFESAHIVLSTPAGSLVEIVDTAANLQAMTPV